MRPHRQLPSRSGSRFIRILSQKTRFIRTLIINSKQGTASHRPSLPIEIPRARALFDHGDSAYSCRSGTRITAVLGIYPSCSRPVLCARERIAVEKPRVKFICLPVRKPDFWSFSSCTADDVLCTNLRERQREEREQERLELLTLS